MPRGGGRHLIADEEMAQALTANYYATMSMVDDNVGRLLEQLKALGLAENTIVVFTADHGNMLGDHGRWFKGVAYEGSARIPLLMKAAANIPAAGAFNRGKVIDEIVENVDVMPTLFDMAGLELPKQGIQGKSMVGLVSGTDERWKNRAFEERGNTMVRTPQYKLIKNDSKELRRGGDEYELYDLVKDPHEEHDLAKDPACAKVLEELKAQLEAWQNDVPPVPTIPGLKIPTYETGSDAKQGTRGKGGLGEDSGDGGPGAEWQFGYSLGRVCQARFETRCQTASLDGERGHTTMRFALICQRFAVCSGVPALAVVLPRRPTDFQASLSHPTE